MSDDDAAPSVESLAAAVDALAARVAGRATRPKAGDAPLPSSGSSAERERWFAEVLERCAVRGEHLPPSVREMIVARKRLISPAIAAQGEGDRMLLGRQLLEDVVTAVFVATEDSDRWLREAHASLHAPDTIEDRRLRVVEAVKARPNIETARELLREAGEEFHDIPDETIRKAFDRVKDTPGGASRRSLCSACAEISIDRAFGDRREPGQRWVDAIRKVAQRYRTAVNRSHATAPKPTER